MGVGIASMHYVGMAAMRMAAELSYYPPLVALSVAIAVGASLGALRLASRFSREGGASPWLKGGGGLLMGAKGLFGGIGKQVTHGGHQCSGPALHSHQEAPTDHRKPTGRCIPV